MLNLTRRRPGRTAGAVAAAAFGLALVATGSADAYTGIASDGATVTVSDVVVSGGAIHLEGSGWLHAAGDGSKIAIKLGSPIDEAGPLLTEPAAGPVTIPGTTTSADGFDIWSAVEAGADGSFALDVPFPTPANTAPALASAWAVGTTHHLTLLTGAMETGDVGRMVPLTFTIGDNIVIQAANGGGRGAPADQVTITATASAGSFAPNEALTATVDGAGKAWTTGGTATATGSLASSTLVFPAGTLRAGPHTVVLTGTTTPPVTRTVTSTPAATFSSLVQGASGTLTLKNLPTGSSVSAVSFGDATFSGLPAAADSTGTATVTYAIPADADLGTFPVSVTTTSPAATYTLAGSKISPDPSPVGGEDDFKLLSNGTGLFQGLYQTAFSASEDALFATASSGTGTSEDGYLYKLDAETLAVETTVHPKELTAGGETGKAPYGVGVDDVNGTVWVSNTRTNTAAVYDADDLTLLKQFPTGTISHSRDVVYDPSTNQVFISSASEGTTGNGYISVFEGGDNDGDGTPYEKITDIQTGPRTDFNPVSLSLADGTLVSPSLQSNKVAKIDTATLAVTYLTITGIDVGGRGASGIAYDASGNRLFIASQNSDEVVIADATTGATLKEVGTGTQALNVAWDDVHQLAYVTNLGSTNVTVLDEEGDKVANLPITRSNHVSVDGRGNAYVADKNTANKVWKIAPTTEAIGGVEITDPTAAGITGAEATTPLSVTVAFGEPIHVGGAGFLVTDKSSGSKIAVKPASVPGSPTIAQIDADDLGTWSADVSYPSTWATGSTHYLRLLTGSLKTGDKPRSIAVKVTVTGAPADPQTPSGSGGGGGGGGGSSTTAEQTDTTEPAATPAPPVESAPSATVPPAGTPATTTPLVLKWATPKVAGRSTVGSKLTANVGSWTAGTKLTYQWFANGKKIAGATKRTFTLTKKQQGQKITVKVTGRKTGYRTVVKTSHATAKVAQRR